MNLVKPWSLLPCTQVHIAGCPTPNALLCIAGYRTPNALLRIAECPTPNVEPILHINSWDQGLSFYARFSIVKPRFQLLNQDFSHFAHWLFKPRFQQLNLGFKLKSGVKFMNPVFHVKNELACVI